MKKLYSILPIKRKVMVLNQPSPWPASLAAIKEGSSEIIPLGTLLVETVVCR